ncbi:uncharacterized protein EI90DRAFT_3017720 [Cantharellus anzutake]|uniref:uncharacterized protein n=1 Tax=Cantharellus anzutake TaxID=1750568 RepID=UPI0019034A7E|nr:uncharacterized protein EI90DRAFT_3017720 [Cantharellus anzutake]KAF8328425.1 hypothetical protein EI90DRAFT_3017720 [Cantharellus anzutake]
MAGVDSDRISIASKRSIASVASKFSTLWSKVPRSSRKIPLPLAVICSYIETTPNAQLSPIKELIVYKEEKGVQHEFLLLRLARPTGEDFWVRLERRRSVGTFGNLISSGLEANDMASLSGKRAALLGSTKSVEKTGIIFRDPPSLTDLLRVLEALRESSKFYKVWPDHGGELGSISPPGSPAFESPIDELEIEHEPSQVSSSVRISNAPIAGRLFQCKTNFFAQIYASA